MPKFRTAKSGREGERMNRKMSGFQPKYSGYIEELRAEGFYYEHEKTGAELFFIRCDDSNKVFSVGFSTVPEDDTGVAHITEHCVLCGSEKYPLKELFMTLDKYSMNTYLNAMTFPDKTLYPVASQNDKDFMNLIDVYMDGIFHPTMYRDELFFRQEGHGFDFENGEDGLPSGVVYNEMKGAMSSPDAVLASKADRALFRNTYRYNSGGDPEAVLDLKYEDFLAFHKKHYHPSNARFYLYGNLDIEKICAALDERISPFGKADKIPEPACEIAAQEPQYIVGEYRSPNSTAAVTLQFVIGDSYELEKMTMAELLSGILFDINASPFKQSLLESGYCTNITGGVDATRMPLTLYITLHGVKEFDPKKVEERLFQELRSVGEDYLTKMIRAYLSSYVFFLREGDTGSNPKGMRPMYSLLLHIRPHEDPFYRLRFEQRIKAVEQMIADGEHLHFLSDFLISNPHRVTVVLKPKPEQEGSGDAEPEKDDSLERWNALTQEQKQTERMWFQRLRKQQESPDSEEALAALPKITLKDIPKTKEYRDVEVTELPASDLRNSNTLLYYPIDSDIVYGKLYFPIPLDEAGKNSENKRSGFCSEDLSLLNAASRLFGRVDTQHRSLSDLSYEVLSCSGDMQYGLEGFEDRMFFSVSFSSLPEKIEKNLELLTEILLHSKLDDEKRFAEIISEQYSLAQLSIVGSGNKYAVNRILAAYDKKERNEYYLSGIGYIKWLKEMSCRLFPSGDAASIASVDPQTRDEAHSSALEPSDAATSCRAKLLRSSVQKYIRAIRRFLTRDDLIFGLCGDENSLNIFRKAVGKIVTKFPTAAENEASECSPRQDACIQALQSETQAPHLETRMPNSETPTPLSEKSTAFIVPADIQFVGLGGKGAKDHHGSVLVMNAVLNTEYLWPEVRMKGGAYGAGIRVNRNGSYVLHSYRDPNLSRTLEIFRNAPAFAKEHPEYLDSAILSAVADNDHPLGMKGEAMNALDRYFSGISAQMLQTQRLQILETSAEDIQRTAEYAEQILNDGHFCVVGNAEKIQEERYLFETAEML